MTLLRSSINLSRPRSAICFVHPTTSGERFTIACTPRERSCNWPRSQDMGFATPDVVLHEARSIGVAVHMPPNQRWGSANALRDKYLPSESGLYQLSQATPIPACQFWALDFTVAAFDSAHDQEAAAVPRCSIAISPGWQTHSMADRLSCCRDRGCSSGLTASKVWRNDNVGRLPSWDLQENCDGPSPQNDSVGWQQRCTDGSPSFECTASWTSYRRLTFLSCENHDCIAKKTRERARRTMV